MKKYLYILILLTLITTSCEKDDFCIDPVTPNLIIRFYDATNNSDTKTVSNLYVWPEGRDSIIVNSVTDSIAIPLDVLNTQTIYNFSDGTNQDQITINYTVNEVFVSRSCGYKAIFNDVSFGLVSNNWINSLTATTIAIENESAAHVQIFH
ncbi:DUF6452 family protein [Pseudotenacibaculum sp. MALMAid0570]|uniref:DUF6452 family protein n=1 Tax=Pseudotenacibaculum sp. MALMAid0570 TaxID=3143938 RepID=UPI0032DFB8A8